MSRDVPTTADRAAIQEAFRSEWLLRVNRIIPVPTAALCAWIVYNADRHLLTLAVLATYVGFNMALSVANVRSPAFDASGHVRAIGNLVTAGLVGFVAGGVAPAWLLGLTVSFASLLMSKAILTMYARGFAFVGLLGGALLAGASIESQVTAFLALAFTSFAMSQFCRPLVDASVEREFQAQALARNNEHLQSALDARRSFLANMSHEIRTPMNGVLGMVSLLQDTPLSPEQHAMLDVVRDSGRSLLTIINDILDISKLEAGRLNIEHIPFSPEEVVSGVVQLIRVGRGPTTVALDYVVDGVPKVLVADPLRVRQILLNLVGNAVKFTTEGSVRVVMSWRAERLRVEVRDTGCGIEADRIEALFEPFEQVDASTTRLHGGTGLGLTISRRLVELLGGELRVESTPGRGSVFFFEIDAPEGAADAPAEIARATIPPGTRVLLVDDNRINLLVAQKMLVKLGCEVVSAHSGAEALDTAAEADFDVVLMDCQMPVMDGFEATRRLRDSGARFPIFALTAGVTEEERGQCAACGMDGVLMKPIASDALEAAIAGCISRS